MLDEDITNKITDNLLDEADLEMEEPTSDTFLTCRLKKMFCTILAEFKNPQFVSPYLSDQELKQFLNRNYRENNHLKHHFEIGV